MQMVYDVSSVTNAMRGKRLLEQNGIRAYVRRKVEADGKNGCGYSLLVPHNTPQVAEILKANGIRVRNGKGREKA